MEQEFVIDIEKCITATDYPYVVRSIFEQVKKNSYVHSGTFFKNLSNPDLELLSRLAEDLHDTDEVKGNYAAEALGMLGTGLLVGDGREITLESFESSVVIVVMYISIESLYRHGLVEVNRDNWSMDPTDDLPIVKLKRV